MTINPALVIDGYKTGHKDQYPENTQEVYSNFTPRNNKHFKSWNNDNKVVFFGLQYFIKDFIIKEWNNNFFNRPKHEVIDEYQELLSEYLGSKQDTYHLERLHDLGYLPIVIKAVDEGTVTPIKTPLITIKNTLPDYYWLTNYLETILSCYMWLPITSATTARQYKMLFKHFANETSDDEGFIFYQGHDFSMRGMSSPQSAIMSGMAHLTSFTGTDTVPAISMIKKVYGGNPDNFIIGRSVPATEHSVMCLGEKETEIDTFKRLINDVYPTGVVSIVSDTWDYWKVITEYLPQLKDNILNRDGTVVIRPDSGDPVKIVCGDQYKHTHHEQVGSIQMLWEIFGGTVNSKGYKVLNPQIRLIYGDGITLEVAEKILEILKEKGFSSENIIFGIGSYSYQYVTRDTLGFAVKATSGVVNNQRVSIFKDPKTDNGLKKSAKGLLMLDSDFNLHEEVSEQEEETGMLTTVFKNGELIKETSFLEIIEKITL
jgi:nicotinamide phosphoribosyltransferase